MTKILIDIRAIKRMDEFGEKFIDASETVKRIDRIMSYLKVGDQVFSTGSRGDMFCHFVTEIIDKDYGIIKVYETIWGVSRYRTVCVSDIMTKDEAKSFARRMGFKLEDD